MKFTQKLASVVLTTGLVLSVPAWAQSAGSTTNRPTDPSSSTSTSGSALNPSDVSGSSNSTHMDRGTAGMRADFGTVDTDGDGRISRSEFSASPMGGNMRSSSTAGANASSGTDMDKPRSNSSATTDTGTAGHKSAAEMFQKLDRNSDNYLDRTEFDAHARKAKDASSGSR